MMKRSQEWIDKITEINRKQDRTNHVWGFRRSARVRKKTQKETSDD
jgi:hypothetical protein